MPKHAQQHHTVVRNTVVMVVTHKYLIQLDDRFFDWHSPYDCHIANEFVHLLNLLVEFLLAGFSFHSELTVPSMGTVVRKPQECECFRFTASAVSPVVFGKPAEFNQPALFLFQGYTTFSIEKNQ